MKNNITIDIIRKEINKWDPMSLLGIAPSDEYEDEIRSIANRLVKYAEVNEAVIGGVIYVVFTKSFGELFTERFNNTDCFSVAAEILKGE